MIEMDPDVETYFEAHSMTPVRMIIIPPQTFFVVGILFSHGPSITFCFLNILKSHCWIFKFVVGILFSRCPCVHKVLFP